MDQTPSDRHADEFFARYTNPTSETIARLKQEAHPDGDIEAVVAEIRDFDFWRRFAAARATRVRDFVLAAGEPLPARVEAARRGYVEPEVLALLPGARVGRRSVEQRQAAAVQADRFWNRLADPVQAERVLARARREVEQAVEQAEAAGRREAAEQVRRRRDAERSRARAARFTVRLQRLEQRWAALAVRQQREAERRLRTEIHPAGMSLERALQIAAAAAAQQATPPQARQ